MLKVVGTESTQEEMEGRSLLDEIAREGARRMLVVALESKVARCGRRPARSGTGSTSSGNILDKLPRRLQPRVKAALHEVIYAETRAQAREAIARFAAEHSAKYPRPARRWSRTPDALLTFFDFPAEHWKHLRTSNVIESPFATVRLRQRVTKGAGSQTKGLLMAYKLRHMAQARWQRIDGAHLPPLVQDGVAFADGVEQVSKRGKRRARAA